MSHSLELQTPEDAARLAQAETVLTPRFYKTDYAAMDRLDMGPIRAEWDAMMAEYQGDNNHDHFQRSPEFAAEVAALSAHWSPELRRDFQAFLVSSLTSEYSGCVLYNEIAKNVSNPDIKQLMRYLTRDESRHANFINQSLKDFGLGVDLVKLKQTKAYTYFKPKYIFYATYLSEKIGYARYISIYRQLERHPEKRFHPIFRWFERWCHDEFRHGESFALMMRAQPHLLQGGNKLWIRFFLLAVYATMYVRDHTRPWLSEALGMDPTEYDYRVFDITTEITRQVFPLSLDTQRPAFRAGLDRLCAISTSAERAKARGGLIGRLQWAWCAASAALCFGRLYLLPTKTHALPQEMRVAPSW
ncbi:MAG: magnesium-protoporphyrin IX monomethyl ester (oxidative) cyclase [Proteobacteria bacterium]|jgi:magnesium-protoporphyrin IX monomethyl ester (oxidative) cyclase|nr:magnesium-protoporphyrin IX monomethyl ester (oxidative) cyclase [Methylibium sp.]MBY0367755.1 magnesium-protoporphyrin IX monomethyl ester (oxidative) cyclase [Burkholderiaceae bacterium]MCH8855120.1 magnesium-protoporphyrin IX monomethyl ester (oxidative) cyclase [Pseudomonadota bacterium]|mmetsp:Transcript_20199/g.37339  ORF Transcript_20199/g.37339 Transcript_20199/m.37339 type:complete len:359 (-) Transcript_20199:193-1269(-)